MQIHGLGQVHGPQQISAPHTQHTAAQVDSPRSDSLHIDQLDISPQADLVSRVRDLPDIRDDRVADIRQQIAAGTYETGDKLDLALSRLLDEIA